MTGHRHFVLATAGHVDHGKSALVKALTGTDPDRLPEEKVRGITIDLGFAHLELPLIALRAHEAFGAAPDPVIPALSSDAPLETLSLGIVDVPGHEDFVKNMVAGVGSIDLALFIVAADDGWMPQSEEHLQILTYLGVTRAVVALTKADLAPGQVPERSAAVRAALARSPFAEAPIVPTSVLTGEGVEALKTALASMLTDAPSPRDFGKPRLPVDRVFTIAGAGTVVTGTLTGGTLRRGQDVILQPVGLSARIRTLQSHNASLETAYPGVRTALNLPDLRPRAETEPQGVTRGDVVTVPGCGDPTDTADVLLEKSARLLGALTPAARPLKDRTRVRVHFGTAHMAAAVFLHGTRELVPGQSAFAQLRFEAPVLLLGNDRFIVRDWSEQSTLAGGRVLDPEGDRKHWQLKAQVALLEARAAAPVSPDGVAVWITSALARHGVLPRNGLLAASCFSLHDIQVALERLAAEGLVFLSIDLAADASWWRSLVARATELIDLAHRVHPEWMGLPLNDLRARLDDDLGIAGTFQVLLASLAPSGFVQAGSFIRRQSHRPQLPSRLQAAGAWLRHALAERPLEPPSRKDLTRDATAVQALKFLIETGEAVEVGPEQVLLADAYARAVGAIRAHLRQHGGATVSELRQLLGCTRRIMIPLCEKLDQAGITRREGDIRTLGRNPTS